MSDPSNVLRGHKAALSNPNVSEEAKRHSAREIQRLEEELGIESSPSAEATNHENHVAGGYKAAINNSNVSDEAKARAQEALADMGAAVYGSAGAPVVNDAAVEEETVRDKQHHNRQLGGYKAVLHNDNMTQEAKDAAAEKLRQAGETVPM